MQTDNSISNTDNNNNNNSTDTNKLDIKNNSINSNDEYKQLISQLTSEEYERLKKSINESKGNVVPIILNKQGVILDGHHRYRACKELGIVPKTETKEFSNQIEEKEFIITINLHRRQLNSFQIAELGVKLEEIEKEKAKLRLSKAGKIGSDRRWKAKSTHDDDVSGNGVVPNGTTLSPKEEEKGRTLDIVAKKIGLSPTTYNKARKIISESAEEQKQRLREGKDKIDKIYRHLNKEKKKSDILNPIKQSSNQNDTLSNPLKTGDLSENSTNEDGCSLCKPIQEKNKELVKAFKSISLQTADKLNPVEFRIPKERQTEINKKFNKCKEDIIIECHGYDKIVSIKADIFKENNQQFNSSISNDQYNNNDTSNDDYTY